MLYYLWIGSVYMSDFLIFCLIIIFIYLFYKYLSKNNFNLNGLELILYELSFIFLFQIGNYYVEFYILQIELGYILLIFLCIYYLLKTIKTQQYTEIWNILIYILLFFINGYSIKKIPTEGLEDLGLAVLYLIFTIGIVTYILLMNFISYIIKEKKGYITEKTNTKIKPLYKSLSKVLILIIIILISISYISFDKYIYSRIEEPYKERIFSYLSKKYIDLDFEIHSNKYLTKAKCKNARCNISDVGYYVKSNLLKDDFYVYIDEQNNIDDNFIEKYYYEITNGDANKYFSDLLSNNFKNDSFNINIIIDVNYEEEKVKSVNKMLKDEELLQLVQINDLKIIINDSFNTIESFEKYATELYSYYESYIGKYNQFKSLDYSFANPELNNSLFKDGGSIVKIKDEITVYYGDYNR